MRATGYRKITGKRRSLLGYTQAWLGADHLLIVDSNRFTERYQRFRFADVQAIIFTESPSRVVWQVLAALVSISWAAWAFQASSIFGKSFFAVTGLIGVVFAIRDVARGPRCRCVVQTAVSRERIRAVSRIPVAERFLAAIQPEIEGLQGILSDSDLATEGTPAVASSWLQAPSQETVLEPPTIRHKRPYTLELFSGILLLDAILVWYALHSNVGTALGLLPTIYIAEISLGAVALFHVRARAIVPAILAVLAVVGVVADIFLLTGPAIWKALAGLGNPPRMDGLMPPSGAAILISSTWRAAVGALGLAACFVERDGDF